MSDNPSSPSQTRVIAAWSQFAWLVLVLAVWTAAVSTLPFDPDYSAGELLDHLMGWIETRHLYPALGQDPTLRVLNYPPLVLMFARGVTALGVTPLVAGRIVGAAGLLVMVFAVALWARARGNRGAALAGTVGLLGASFGIIYGSGKLHVEFWAVGFTVAGFSLLDGGRNRRTAIVAGLLLAIACFAKQTQVVSALAALVWAWRARRDLAPVAIAAFVAAGILGSAWITAVWGLEPWRHMILYTAGTYSLGNLGLQFLSHVAPWWLLIGWVGVDLVKRRRDVAGDLLAWYWVVSALWALAAARVGSGYQYFLDLQVATALWVGPKIFAAPIRRPLSWMLAIQVVAVDLGAAAFAAKYFDDNQRVAAALPAICAEFRPAGLVLTEEVSLARACGRTAVMQPFIMTSLATRGLWNPAPFEAAVRSGAYSPVLLPFDPRAPEQVGEVEHERWTPGMLAAFRTAASIAAGPGGLWVLRW